MTAGLKPPNFTPAQLHTYIPPGYRYVGNVRHRVAHTPRWAKSQPGSETASVKKKRSQDRLWARLDELEREEVREEAEEESKAAPAGGPSNVESVCAEGGHHLEVSQPLTQRITFQHTKSSDVAGEDQDSKQVMLLYVV